MNRVSLHIQITNHPDKLKSEIQISQLQSAVLKSHRLLVLLIIYSQILFLKMEFCANKQTKNSQKLKNF